MIFKLKILTQRCTATKIATYPQRDTEFKMYNSLNSRGEAKGASLLESMRVCVSAINLF